MLQKGERRGAGGHAEPPAPSGAAHRRAAPARRPHRCDGAAAAPHGAELELARPRYQAVRSDRRCAGGISLSDSDMLSNSEYQRWDKRFSMPDYLFCTAPNAFLESQAHVLPKSGAALAVADGEGRNGVWLAERGLRVPSPDWSPAAPRKAEGPAQQPGDACPTVRGGRARWAWP